MPVGWTDERTDGLFFINDSRERKNEREEITKWVDIDDAGTSSGGSGNGNGSGIDSDGGRSGGNGSGSDSVSTHWMTKGGEKWFGDPGT